MLTFLHPPRRRDIGDFDQSSSSSSPRLDLYIPSSSTNRLIYRTKRTHSGVERRFLFDHIFSHGHHDFGDNNNGSGGSNNGSGGNNNGSGENSNGSGANNNGSGGSGSNSGSGSSGSGSGKSGSSNNNGPGSKSQGNTGNSSSSSSHQVATSPTPPSTPSLSVASSTSSTATRTQIPTSSSSTSVISTADSRNGLSSSTSDSLSLIQTSSSSSSFTSSMSSEVAHIASPTPSTANSTSGAITSSKSVKLGVILGSIFGALFLLTSFLILFLRYRRQRATTSWAVNDNGINGSDKSLTAHDFAARMMRTPVAQSFTTIPSRGNTEYGSTRTSYNPNPFADPATSPKAPSFGQQTYAYTSPLPTGRESAYPASYHLSVGPSIAENASPLASSWGNNNPYIPDQHSSAVTYPAHLLYNPAAGGSPGSWEQGPSVRY